MQVLPVLHKKRMRLIGTFRRLGQAPIYVKSNSGQALLAILLVMAVTLTVVLSVASRSVTEIGITTYEEDAVRAFSAAEAGVEEALITGADASGTLPNNATFDAVISSAGSPSEFIYPVELVAGETATFWLVSQGADGNLTCSGQPCLRASRLKVCWGKPGTPRPAVEISLFYDEAKQAVVSGDLSQLKVARFAYDPDGARRFSNNFSPASGSCIVLGQTIRYSSGNIDLASLLGGPCATTSPPGCLLMVRVRMFYNGNNPHLVGIVVQPAGGSSLPSQGIQIESTGVSGEATREVNVYRSYPQPAPIFDVAIFSGGGIAK